MLDALALKHERRRPNLVTFLWSFPFLLIPLCSHETPTRHSKGQLWNPLRDQFTLSFQLTKPNCFVSNTSHRCRNHCLSGNLPSFLKHFICLRSQIYCVAINNIKINYFIVLNTIIVQIIFIVIINIIMILHHVMLLKMNSRRIAINTVILVFRRFFLRFGGVCFIIFAISWYSEPLNAPFICATLMSDPDLPKNVMYSSWTRGHLNVNLAPKKNTCFWTMTATSLIVILFCSRRTIEAT